MGIEGRSPPVLAHHRFMSIWGVVWETKGKVLCPLGLFLTIDPGWTEGQQARNRCISADIAAEMESWDQDPGRCGDRKGVGESREWRWSSGSPGQRDGPKNVHPESVGSV